MKTIVKEFLVTIKRELLLHIIMGMKKLTLDSKKAQELAMGFEVADKSETQEEILQVLFVLTRDYKEALEVYLKYAPDFYEEKRVCLISTIRQAVEQGDMDGAVAKAYGRCTW